MTNALEQRARELLAAECQKPTSYDEPHIATRHAHAAIEAALRLSAGAEWRPIETAPKTGVPIILGYTGSHSAEGYWMSEASLNYWGETGWFYTDSDILCDHPCKPTHWQPLPMAPGATEERLDSLDEGG